MARTSRPAQDDQKRSQRRDEQRKKPPGCELTERQRAAAQVQHRQNICGNQIDGQQKAQRLGIHSGLIVSFFMSGSKRAIFGFHGVLKAFFVHGQHGFHGDLRTNI